jgi:hypothetical protein
MFRLRRMENESRLNQVRSEIKNKLEALTGKIDVIRSMEVGINIVTSDRAFDLVLISSFDNLDDLETYRIHPAHREVVDYIASVREQTAAVDYVF